MNNELPVSNRVTNCLVVTALIV